jgi:hypothetical protein
MKYPHKLQYLKTSAVVAALYMAAMPVQASAESLSEDNIRSMYSELDANVRSADKNVQALKSRLDDDYVVTTESAVIFGGNPPVAGEYDATKSQILLDMPKLYTFSTIDQYKRTIVDIKFSTDKNWAYVSLTKETEGKMEFAPGGAQSATLKFSTQSSCIDTLGVKSGKLKIQKSECKERTTVTPPQ